MNETPPGYPSESNTTGEPSARTGTDGAVLNISWAELNEPTVTSRVDQMRAARQVPLVREVGAPGDVAPTGPLAWLRGSVGALCLAGVIGAIISWALIEVVLRPDAEKNWYGSGRHTGDILFSVAIALGIGLVVAAWDGVEARSLPKAGQAMLKAAPVLVVGGALGGYLASNMYRSMMTGVLEKAQTIAESKPTYASAVQAYNDYVHSHVHLPRGLAIGLVGIAIGAALGAASLSWQRALNGAIGGAVGGFVGGFLFDYFSSDSGSGVFPRLVALLVTGLLIGGSMGLIETARREHWLEILSGGMAGKQFILYNEQTTIGADAGCQVTLIKDPAIAPRHAVLTRSANGLTVRTVDPTSPALVNGQPVHEHLLADSDMLQLGHSMLRYRSKASSAPVQAGIHG
jgi:type IV secretory pathway VirB2 component (pilin)